MTVPPPPLVSKVEVRIKCKNLLNRDVMSKSDPMVACYLVKDGISTEVGRTENIRNSLNPEFSKAMLLDYYFEEVQKLSFYVYDIDNSTPDLSDDDYLGGVETTLSLLVASNPLTVPLCLRNGARAGTSTIMFLTEEIGNCKKQIQMSFCGRKLDKKDFFGKSDPYLEISRHTVDGSWMLVHRTEVIKNTLNPTWRTFFLSGNALNMSNAEQEIKLSCFDYDNDGSHDFIGEVVVTVASILEATSKPVEWSCINPKKKAKKGSSYVDSGKLLLTSCKVTDDYSFLDYIFGGCQLNFTVGVDFTASNGNPSNPQSLHYLSMHQPNEYMQAILAVGTIIQDYDSDKMFPALGFGARIPPTNAVSHEFSLNFNATNPFCQGVEGILNAYQMCLPNIQLYGPTNISPIIYHVMKFAEHAQSQPTASNYYVLLILTDGVISDMQEARRAIVFASQLCMSIIIVGVGGADFTDMQMLDGDDGVLRAPDGTPVARDIVQFVPFRKFQSPTMLSREVLAEIPKQVADYFRMRGLAPPRKPTEAHN